MASQPFTCAKSGREFTPDKGGRCCICRKIYAGEYLVLWKFEDGKRHPVCVDDLKMLKEKRK